MALENVLAIMAKLIAAVFAGCVVYLVPKVREFLNEKIGTENAKAVESAVKVLVEAAEELLKDEDPTGEKRKSYVLEQVAALGIECDGYVNALIESFVRGLGHAAPETVKKTTKKVTTKA